MELYFKLLLWTFILFSARWKMIHGKSFIEDLTLSSDEKAALEKFGELVKNHLPHEYMQKDVYLIRWLRAKRYNLEEAEKMLLENLKWREENQMETIHNEDWSDMVDYKYYMDSRDREGKPVLYINLGMWSLRKATISGKSERLLRYIDRCLDEASILVRNMGEMYHNVSQGNLILNVDGFSLVQHACLRCIPIILKLIVSYETHFPGLADQLILVNVPILAHPIIEVAKAALDPETRKIVFIYGTNKQVWSKALSKDFKTEELPRELGGTKYHKGSEDDYDFSR